MVGGAEEGVGEGWGGRVSGRVGAAVLRAGVGVRDDPHVFNAFKIISGVCLDVVECSYLRL